MNTDPSRPIGFRRSAPWRGDPRGIGWRFWIGPLLVRRTVRGVQVAWTRPETDVRLSDDERTILTAYFWGRRITANATHLADLITPAVERIVAERVREVEGERDAARAEGEIVGQMRHITAEMVRGDQPLEAKEEMIADLRARLSHVEAERDGWRDRAATNRDGWRQMIARAESAEAAHEALRAGIEALADEWERTHLTGFCSNGCDYIGRGNRERFVADLRALLAGDAR